MPDRPGSLVSTRCSLNATARCMFRKVCRGAMVMHSRGSSVIKFCIASQLLFGRGPAGSFAFGILGYARAPRSLRLFLLFPLSRGNKRLLRDNPRRNSRGGKISGERADEAPLSSARFTARRFCQFPTNRPAIRSLAIDRDITGAARKFRWQSLRGGNLKFLAM
jgi:hypothetical protein